MNYNLLSSIPKACGGSGSQIEMNPHSKHCHEQTSNSCDTNRGSIKQRCSLKRKLSLTAPYDLAVAPVPSEQNSLLFNRHQKKEFKVDSPPSKFLRNEENDANITNERIIVTDDESDNSPSQYNEICTPPKKIKECTSGIHKKKYCYKNKKDDSSRFFYETMTRGEKIHKTSFLNRFNLKPHYQRSKRNYDKSRSSKILNERIQKYWNFSLKRCPNCIIDINLKNCLHSFTNAPMHHAYIGCSRFQEEASLPVRGTIYTLNTTTTGGKTSSHLIAYNHQP